MASVPASAVALQHGPEALSDSCAKEMARFLKLLSHPSRLRLAHRIAEGECSVSDLEQELGIRQPGLSQHLSELRDGALVETRREHKVVFYRMKDYRMPTVLSILQMAFAASAPVRHAASVSHAPAQHADAAVFAQTRNIP